MCVAAVAVVSYYFGQLLNVSLLLTMSHSFMSICSHATSWLDAMASSRTILHYSDLVG
jgi:hypothetical protein